jgi:universal stress protein A
MISCATILVAVDFSAASDKALLYGRELSRLMCAKLYVIHVVSDMVAAGLMTPTDLAAMGRAPEDLEHGARQRLRALIEDGADQEASPTIVVRVGSSPAAEILDYVKEQPIDLVVVGSHGHSAAAQVLLGSVAEKVVRSAACPVLTVRTAERDFIQPATLTATG